MTCDRSEGSPHTLKVRSHQLLHRNKYVSKGICGFTHEGEVSFHIYVHSYTLVSFPIQISTVEQKQTV